MRAANTKRIPAGDGRILPASTGRGKAGFHLAHNFCEGHRLGPGVPHFLRTFFPILLEIHIFLKIFFLHAGQGLAPPVFSPSPILCAQNGYMASKGRKAIGLPEDGVLTTEDAAGDWLAG